MTPVVTVKSLLVSGILIHHPSISGEGGTESGTVKTGWNGRRGSELLAGDDLQEGETEHLCVEKKAMVAKVEEVEVEPRQHLVHRVGVPVVEGGVAGNTGTDLVQVPVPRVAVDNLVDVELAFRPLSD